MQDIVVSDWSTVEKWKCSNKNSPRPLSDLGTTGRLSMNREGEVQEPHSERL